MLSFLQKYWVWCVLLFFLILGFLVFGRVLGYGFVILDDDYLISRNAVLKTITPTTLKQIFSTYDPELYIPLTFFSYQLDYLIGGGSPWVFHLTNLLLHIANAFLVFLLVLAIRDKRLAVSRQEPQTACRLPLAAFVGLLFLLHPINIEAIVWASGRKDVLSTFFLLLALLAYVRRSQERLLLSLVFFLLALLSKVTVVVFVPLVFLLDVWMKRPLNRKLIIEKIPFILLSILFGLIAVYGKTSNISSLPPWQILLLFLKSIVFYLWKIALPGGSSPLYIEHSTVTIVSPAFAVPMLFLIALIVSLVFLSRFDRTIGFGAAWFCIALLPTFATYAKAGYIYLGSDRYVYIASIGIFLLVGVLVTKATKDRLLPLLLLLLLFPLALLSYRQTAIWSSSEALFRHAVAMDPNSFPVHNNLGVALLQQGRLDEAEREFTEALRIQPYAKAAINLGNIRRRQGRMAEAQDFFEQAADIDPRDPEPHFALANLLAEQGRKDHAIAEFRRILSIDPNHTPAMNNLGALLLERDDLTEARKIYEELLARNPYYSDAHFNMGLLEERSGNAQAAADEFLHALEAQPTLLPALTHATSILLERKEYPPLVDAWRRSVNRAPGDPEILEGVLSAMKQILAADPNEPSARALVKEMIDRGLVRTK